MLFVIFLVCTKFVVIYSLERRPGSMTVNGKPLQVESDEKSDSGVFLFSSGRQGRFACEHDFSDGRIMLQYTAPDGKSTRSTEHQVAVRLEWYMRLSADNHGAVLACFLHNPRRPAGTFVVSARLLMVAGPQELDVPGFEVNGLMLVAAAAPRARAGPRLQYEYRCEPKEQLDIAVRYPYTAMYEHSTCAPLPPSGEWQDNYKGYKITCPCCVRGECGDTVVSCHTTYNSTTDDMALTLRHRNDGPIHGVSLAKVLMKYKKKDSSGRNNNTMVVYEYNTHSNLTCGTPHWIYNSSEVSCPEDDDGKPATCTFHLKYNKTTVRCSTYYVELVRTKPAELALLSHTRDQFIVVVAGGVAAVTAIVVAFLLVVVCVCRKPRKQNPTVYPPMTSNSTQGPDLWTPRGEPAASPPPTPPADPPRYVNTPAADRQGAVTSYAAAGPPSCGQLSDLVYAVSDIVPAHTRACYINVASNGGHQAHYACSDILYVNDRTNANVNVPATYDDSAYSEVYAQRRPLQHWK